MFKRTLIVFIAFALAAIGVGKAPVTNIRTGGRSGKN